MVSACGPIHPARAPNGVQGGGLQVALDRPVARPARAPSGGVLWPDWPAGQHIVCPPTVMPGQDGCSRVPPLGGVSAMLLSQPHWSSDRHRKDRAGAPVLARTTMLHVHRPGWLGCPGWRGQRAPHLVLPPRGSVSQCASRLWTSAGNWEIENGAPSFCITWRRRPDSRGDSGWHGSAMSTWNQCAPFTSATPGTPNHGRRWSGTASWATSTPCWSHSPRPTLDRTPYR